jgi:hypothetical protein
MVRKKSSTTLIFPMKTIETTMQNDSKAQELSELEKVKQNPKSELIDDCFYVWETRFGLFSTITKEGREMLTGGTRDGIVNMTRWHLKCEQDGTLHLYTRVVGSITIAVDL